MFRAWLAKNHLTADELLVGFHKKDSGKASITWPESVDEALCHGWIDGVRRRLDETSYTIRFTPRRPRSIWSSINIARMKVLLEQGRVTPAGRAAFERRSDDKSSIYAYEQRAGGDADTGAGEAVQGQPKGVGLLHRTGAVVPAAS